MSTDQPIPESGPAPQPIWTPEDARQTARDAAKYVATPGTLTNPDEPFLPFVRSIKRLCPCCASWPGEPCDPGCLSWLNAEQQQQYRADVLEDALAELGLLDDEPDEELADAHRRVQRRAAQLAKASLCVALIVMILVVGVLWAEQLGAL